MDKGRRILTMICTNCSCHNDINCVNLKKLKTTLKEVLKSGHLHFLLRDAMCSRSLLSPGVCPSLRLSVTLVHCIHTAEDIVKILIRPSSPIILVFDPQRRHPIPRITTSAMALNTRGRVWRKLAIFNINRRLSRKRYETGPWLLWNVNRKS